MMDNKGQISAELLFLFGVLVIVVILSIAFISQEQELTLAICCSKWRN